ncbi:MAG: Bax inhibitor-1/YccA family protein [Planctomycetota bacterium]
MSSFSTRNPVLARAFEKPQPYGNLEQAAAAPKVMTIGGTVNAAITLLCLCAAGAVGGWMLVERGMIGMMPLWIGAMLGGLVLSLIISFKKTTAPFLGPIYAAIQGVFLGGFSLYVSEMLNARFGGTVGQQTVFQAVILTLGVFAAMLLAYKTGLIRSGPIFRRVMAVGALGYMLFFVVALVMSFFGQGTLISVFDIQNGSPISIIFSVVVCALAAFSLVVDFDFIDQGAKHGLPKHMEWYGAFALTVTLVWLYFEILRLLAKIKSSD